MKALMLSRWLGAAALLAAASCTQSRPPEPVAVQVQPEDPLVDDAPVIGLVEPRVIESPIVQVTPDPPAFSAETETLYQPDSTRSVGEVRELSLRLTIMGMRNPAELTLELIQPSGNTYEARAAQLAGDPFQKYEAEFVVPVAGTAIDRANLSGTWTARYLLRGEVIATDTFELLP